MLKWRLMIVLALMGIGIALTAARAQQDQPITQPTVDAAVATLIAQTQAAPAHLNATQTIQSALNQALTATQMALITPTLTPQSFDASSLKVTNTAEVDLLAGPAGTAAYLAPDGEHFAYLNVAADTLCIYQATTQQNCFDLSQQVKGIDSETPRWSPDSRYLAFTEEFFRSLRDPDIWVLDTQTGKAADLTDDGSTKIDLGADWLDIDVFPRWTSDGKIIFLRYSRKSGQILPPEVHEIAPDGTGDRTLGTLLDPDPFAVYALDVWRDKLVYAYTSQAGSISDGVWISDFDGTNRRQVMHAAHNRPIDGVEMSPDGKYILITAENTTNPASIKPEDSRFSLIDATTGKPFLIDPDRPVKGAGWSPQGSALIYIAHDVANLDDLVYVSNTPGEAGKPLEGLQGHYNIATPRLIPPLIWGANNTILISHSPDKGIVLLQLGS